MPTDNPFPLNISEKEDSWNKLQVLSNVAPGFKYTAEEFNKIITALEYIYENMAGSPANTNIIIIDAFPFRLFKGPGNNVLGVLETGDVIQGFEPSGSFIIAKYLGGDSTDFLNESVYTIFSGL